MGKRSLHAAWMILALVPVLGATASRGFFSAPLRVLGGQMGFLLGATTFLKADILFADAEDKDAKAVDKAPPQPRDVELEGQAVLLGPAIRKDLKIDLENDALDKVVAFKTTKGKLIPILPSESGLFFYSDERVRDRPMRVKARISPLFEGIEVIDRHSIVGGKVNEIYYWCEICSIRMHHLKQCDCCQGPVELREHPIGERFPVKND